MNQPLDPEFANPKPPASVSTVLAAIYFTIACIVGYGSAGFTAIIPWLNLESEATQGRWGLASLFFGAGGVILPIALLALIIVALVKKTGAAFPILRAAYATMVLVVFPVWGIFINHIQHTSCTITPCGGAEEGFRTLGEPGIFVLAGLQAIVALAFAISRRRPEALHPRLEPWIHAAMLAGIIEHAFLGIQFGGEIILGTILFPFGGAAITPVLTIALLAIELVTRLRRRGQEAATPPPVTVADPFRGAEVHPLPATPRFHVPTFLRAIAATPVFLGLYAIVSALVYETRWGAVKMFTMTCDHTFSQIAVTHLPAQGECHYLCTVAARGHRWLARPERMGVRRGQPIVVNRQLAIANAFEDLLHERWPRFGRLARRIYDRIGFPISHLITNVWLADLVFVVMKPFEWLFLFVLLLVDRKSPEQRIDRMYR